MTEKEMIIERVAEMRVVVNTNYSGGCSIVVVARVAMGAKTMMVV